MRLGQVLRIPMGESKTATLAPTDTIRSFTHTVEKGETIYSITKGYAISTELLQKLNPELKELPTTGLRQGQVLRIPIKNKQSPPTGLHDTSRCILHTIEKGESIYSITKRYAVSAELLQKLNPELKEGLKKGQVIRLPSFEPRDTSVSESSSATADSILGTTSYVGEFKTEYKIAFFLPFNKGHNNGEGNPPNPNGHKTAYLWDLPNRTSIALQFYEGALIAIDSLKKQKLNAKIYVYDVDDNDSSNLVALLKKPELATMNLIVGPLYGTSFMPVAKFAKEHMIPIVSPFTQVNKILFNNPYVCKVSPSTVLQVEQMAHYVVDSFKNENLILVNSMNARYASFFDTYKKTANVDLIKVGKALSDSLKLLYNVNAIESVLTTTKVNVIALPSNDQPYVSDFISKLHMIDDKYKIVLIGMQNWIAYDNMDYEYLNKISLHVPSNGLVDYSTPTAKAFVKRYQERYKTDPDVYGFQGYDVTYYFLSMLQKYGTGFLNTIKNSPYKGIETDFNFAQFPADSGFENQSVLILKYQDYQLIKALK